MGPFLPQYFDGMEGESGNTQIFILHKRHIQPDSDGKHCGADYIRADHPLRWQADQIEFMQAQILGLQGHSPRRLVVLGISEGAELAPILARQLKATHLVLLSHAGLNALDLYASLAREQPHMRMAWQQLQTALQTVPDDVDVMELPSIHGRSWRYWSEIATIPQTKNLLELDIPIMLAYGDADPVIPQHAIEQLQQRFLSAGKSLHTVRFAGAGHDLRVPGKNYLPDFMHQVDNWLQETKP